MENATASLNLAAQFSKSLSHKSYEDCSPVSASSPVEKLNSCFHFPAGAGTGPASLYGARGAARCGTQPGPNAGFPLQEPTSPPANSNP